MIFYLYVYMILQQHELGVRMYAWHAECLVCVCVYVILQLYELGVRTYAWQAK